MDAAINGVLQSLDPYSAYMSPEVFNDMQTETSGKFGGLGIEVGMEHGVCKSYFSNRQFSSFKSRRKSWRLHCKNK